MTAYELLSDFNHRFSKPKLTNACETDCIEIYVAAYLATHSSKKRPQFN